MIDEYEKKFKYKNQFYKLKIFDCGGKSDLAAFRKLAYD